ncbi:MAG: hypothetical protein M3441_25355 [Chloroflexota bacterium]|nr:hypothetical protein [Chloroflexota bacterium]
MSNKQDRRLSRLDWLRVGLLFLAASGLGAGLWPLPFPRAFYEDFPLPGRDWVSALGPYNEHLIRDYGGLNLAFGVLFLFAALFPERRLVQASLVAWLFYAVPHFVFHASQMHHFSLGDNLAQLISLGFLIVLPLVLLLLPGTGEQSNENAATGDFARPTGGSQRRMAGTGWAKWRRRTDNGVGGDLRPRDVANRKEPPNYRGVANEV